MIAAIGVTEKGTEMITQGPVRGPTRICQDQWWVPTVGAVVLAILATPLFSPELITGSKGRDAR